MLLMQIENKRDKGKLEMLPLTNLPLSGYL